MTPWIERVTLSGGEISSVLKNGWESEISMWMLRQLTSVEKRKCHSIKRSKDQGAPAMGLLEGRRRGRRLKQMPQPYRLTTSRLPWVSKDSLDSGLLNSVGTVTTTGNLELGMNIWAYSCQELLWFRSKMSPTGSRVWTSGPQLAVLFGKLVGSLGHHED